MLSACVIQQKLLDFSQRCDLSVVEIYIFFQTIELPLYQNSIVDAMRMYLGHICTVVSLPSCHFHCLSCLAFMYCRTKYFSPVIFFEMWRTVLCFTCDCLCFLSTTVTLNILVMLVLPFIDYALVLLFYGFICS